MNNTYCPRINWSPHLKLVFYRSLVVTYLLQGVLIESDDNLDK